MGDQGIPAVRAGPALEQMEVPGRKHCLWRSQARAEERNERERSLYIPAAALCCTACSVVKALGETFGGNSRGRTGLGMRSAKERRRKGCFPLWVKLCLSDSNYLNQ